MTGTPNFSPAASTVGRTPLTMASSTTSKPMTPVVLSGKGRGGVISTTRGCQGRASSFSTASSYSRANRSRFQLKGLVSLVPSISVTSSGRQRRKWGKKPYFT